MQESATVGLVFNNQRTKIILIEKQSTKYPELNGTWCGPGGKIEHNEKPIDCMVREFQEEVGLVSKPEEWNLVALQLPNKGFGHIHYFSLFTGMISQARQMEEERMEIWEVKEAQRQLKLSPHIKWLMHVAIDPLISTPFVFKGGRPE